MLLLGWGLSGLLSLGAQTPSPPGPEASPAGNARPELPPPHGPMANLTQEERHQLKAAHDRAIQLNPSIEEEMKSAHLLMEKARKRMHDAMIAVDPSVAPILAKILPPRGERGEERGPGRQTPGGRHGPHGLGSLTEGERQQLLAARQKVKDDPSVAAARAAFQTAATPEARRMAGEGLRQAADAAMLRVDPSLGPILEKLAGEPPPSPSPGAPMQEAPPAP
jgi:hypothetical protein